MPNKPRNRRPDQLLALQAPTGGHPSLSPSTARTKGPYPMDCEHCGEPLFEHCGEWLCPDCTYFESVEYRDQVEALLYLASDTVPVPVSEEPDAADDDLPF